jgi:hypothetical protein
MSERTLFLQLGPVRQKIIFLESVTGAAFQTYPCVEPVRSFAGQAPNQVTKES